jgi:SAM-dependent methyltransferase
VTAVESGASFARIGASMRDLLAHPLTRDLAIDDPRTTERRRSILADKQFLRRIYLEWYGALARALPARNDSDRVLEVGSGAGFLAELGIIPDVVTSEVFPVPGVDLVLDARRIPLRSGTLRGIVMVDTLHHVAHPRSFLAEAVRCLRPGGVLTMIEPWVTDWSRLVYRHLHHEPFLPESESWEFPESGPLSGANGALPWMIFERDRATFEREFPELHLVEVRPMMPARYLVSGGVAMRSLVPGWLYAPCRTAENLLAPFMRRIAMFAQITVVRA